MPNIKFRCDFCGATLLVRPDQLGRRVRCSKCRYAFLAEQTKAHASEPSQEEPPLSLNTEPPGSEAQDANEMASVPPPAPSRTWNRAKISARFERASNLLFEACAQAVRGCNCDVLDIDRVNLRIKFAFAVSGEGSDHICNIFPSGDGAAEMEIISWGPNVENQYDVYYETIIREVGKYLMFAANSPKPESSSKTKEKVFEDSEGHHESIESRSNSGDPQKRNNEKYCVECGKLILARAVICPKCGVPQGRSSRRNYAGSHDDDYDHAEEDYERDYETDRYSRRRQKRSVMVNAVAIINYVFGGIGALLGLVFLIALKGARDIGVPGGYRGCIGFSIILISTLYLIAGHLIWNRRNLGQWLGIGLGFLAGISAILTLTNDDPFGFLLNTAYAAFTLVVLFNPRFAREFRQ